MRPSQLRLYKNGNSFDALYAGLERNEMTGKRGQP
jgi:hypothetical protein